MMTAVAGLVVTNYHPGLVRSSCSCPRVLLGKWSWCKGALNSNSSTTQFAVQRRRVLDQGSSRRLFQVARHVMSSSSGRNHQLLAYDDDDLSTPEPYWLSRVKEVLWSLKSLSMFLREQPGQLKYIEWPSFQSTLKTATLTLVLVAVLIVALTSVDASLSFMSRLLLKKSL